MRTGNKLYRLFPQAPVTPLLFITLYFLSQPGTSYTTVLASAQHPPNVSVVKPAVDSSGVTEITISDLGCVRAELGNFNGEGTSEEGTAMSVNSIMDN